MFIEDLKNDFYNVLLGNRVLLLVHYDVDAICTCKILQELFKSDNISYTLVPVGGISELKTAYEENNEEIKYVVLVNCGGTIDLVDILQPEEDVVFFVLDSHKPTDICNVYSDGQVRIVYKDAEENIPNFDDIFRDDDDDEEEEPTESGIEGLEAAVERRRARKAWEERRHTLMFNYTQFSYYGKPSACVCVELAWVVSRCGWGAVWAGAVAAAAAQALHARAPAQCLLDADALHRHVAGQRAHQAQAACAQLAWVVSRCGWGAVWAGAVAAAAAQALHARAPAQCLLDADALHRHVAGQRAHQAQAASCRVVLEKDLWLPLYRSWSLEAALRHAPALAPRLRLHTRAGLATLRRLLADMGFPLQQARQAYRSMDVELRRCLLSALETAAPKHQLPDPARAAFLLTRPHAPARPAHDLVYVILGLIEHDTMPRGEGFQHALAALDVEVGGAGSESVRRGCESAMRSLQAVARLVHATLSARKLLLAGPFSYFIVQEGTPEAAAVRGPLWLGVAVRWAAAAAAGARPLLASAPAGGDTCLLIGVPPRYDHEPRNLFGAAFEQAAAKSGASVSLDYLDSSVITLPTSQRPQFLDALTALLA